MGANAVEAVEKRMQELCVKEIDSRILGEAVMDELRKLDKIARPGAILATNTSMLDVNRIASFTSRPQDVVGTHFFSPANVMPLLEVVRTDTTGPAVIKTVMELAKKRSYEVVERHVEYAELKNVKEIFEMMPSQFNADAAKGMNSVIQFNLSGDGDMGGQYHAVIKDGKLEVAKGVHASPSMTMTMAGSSVYVSTAGFLPITGIRSGRWHALGTVSPGCWRSMPVMTWWPEGWSTSCRKHRPTVRTGSSGSRTSAAWPPARSTTTPTGSSGSSRPKS